MAVGASETAVGTTVLQAERDQHEAGFFLQSSRALDTRPERLELLSFELRLAVRFGLARSALVRVRDGLSGWGERIRTSAC